jgi:deoxyribodipyrimidine photo-lyase
MGRSAVTHRAGGSVKPTLQVVWFKRDLRIEDHEPLAEAARRGPVLPIYIAEASMLGAPDFDSRHWTFIRAGLIELRRTLFAMGQPLVVRIGEATPILEELHREMPFARIWAHEETGNAHSSARDAAVKEWAIARKIRFTEIPHNGIERGVPAGDGWAGRWEERMRRPLIEPPARLKPATGLQPGPIPDHSDLNLDPDRCSGAQRGGEQLGQQTLASFLARRGETYEDGLSSPIAAWNACSRISPFLTWGNLSLRQVIKATRARAGELRALPPHQRGTWPSAISAFESRLQWRSEFMQKYEDDPQIEQDNMIRAYDGLRESEFNRERFDAWAAGLTGYPMIDACMRALKQTGWLNYRMRAMLVSFASFDLWLHWREPGLHLARLSLDYEPGIHWNQIQMHAGTTGLSPVRIYNPTKQAQEQDPEGTFIRRWVPELEHVPTSFIHTPWLLPEEMQRAAGCVIGEHYPAPIVDHATASREAQHRVYEVRGQPHAREETRQTQDRHGDRRELPKAPRVRRVQREKPTQLSFPTE